MSFISYWGGLIRRLRPPDVGLYQTFVHLSIGAQIKVSGAELAKL